METVNIEGTKRSEINKRTTKAVRAEGLVPCVIYGGEENIHFTAKAKAFKTMIYTPDFKMAEITIDGTPHKCIMKDMQFHPVSDELLHLDFLKLVPGHKIKVELPIRFKGVAPGVKTGGKLLTKMRRVKVKTTPESLVDELLVDISNLELNESVRVRDIEIHGDLEIMSAPGIPVASVETPRALKSLEAEEEEAAAAAAAAAGEAGEDTEAAAPEA